jgi:Gene product 88
MLLKFARGNAKLDALESVIGGQVWTFSELSGHTCPFALDCFSKAVEVDGKRTIVDGPKTQFRCFSASQEALFPAVYNARKYNTDLVTACKTAADYAHLIYNSLPKKAKCIRIHVGGDFRLQRHLEAWNGVAQLRPDLIFYAYTKALPHWVAIKDKIVNNFILTASRGGKRDDLIDSESLREARVVFSEQEAIDLGLEIDHDDSHAALPALRNQSFALLIHGTQPKGSKASKAVAALDGKGTYGRGAK